MKKIIFQLGTMHELCLAEVKAGFDASVIELNRQAALAAVDDELDTRAVINQLGGTIKIATVWQELPKEATPEEIQRAVSDYLLALQQSKVYFVIGELGRDHLERLDLFAIKQQLQDGGVKVRFNERSRQGASAALLLNNQKLIEILVVQGKDQLYLARTTAVQDIDDWTLRDRSKPYADHKKGMLPPKLARIMVNLTSNGQLPEPDKTKRVYDPFCGSGTVLMEAAAYDWQLIGTDLDAQAVIGARENLEWLQATYQRPVNSKLLAKDVTQVSAAEIGGPVDYIVTEPFLGRQTPKSKDLANIFRGLEKMYWGAFRHWRALLRDGSTIVIVFPQVEADDHRLFTLESLLDKLEGLGYTKRSCGLFYARPGAVVRREICVFEYREKKN